MRCVYRGLLFSCQIYNDLPFHEGGRLEEDILKIMEEEKTRAGLDSSVIKIRDNCVDENGETDGVKRNGEIYEFYVSGRWKVTRNAIRHEMYHIKKDCNRKKNWFIYFFFEEFRATVYGTFGIKI